MAKIADRYLKLDPWKIAEEGFDRGRSLVSESIFSLGNEYMGIRGYFDEGGGGPSLRGSYFNGVYEVERVAGSAYKGIVDVTHFMVNAVDWLKAELWADGEKLDLAKSSVSGFRRELNLKTGVLFRSFTWITRAGNSLGVTFTRFLDMEAVEYGYQRIELKALSGNPAVRVMLSNDSTSLHEGRKKCYWKGLRSEALPRDASGGPGTPSGALLAETLTTGLKVFSGFAVTNDRGVAGTVEASDRRVTWAGEFVLPEGESAAVSKTVYNLAERDGGASADDLWERGLQGLRRGEFLDINGRAEIQRRYWAHLWETMDIRIDGDGLNQQGIRFCIFQMQQTYHGQNPANNIGAKGLTGEAYNGHAFWDTETYCLPFYLFSNLGAARNLLEFRYKTLPKARRRAAMLDCAGACYPVATLNGDEACDLWQHASLQFQPSTAVAYGIAHYAALSSDDDFLFGHGAEMLVEISRFLRSRGAWNDRGFGFYAVMGPDEFHMMVNHNVYTNLMAKKTFEFTLATLDRMGRERPEVLKALEKRLGVTTEETAEWKACAEGMIILYDGKTKLYEQHEGYFGMPHIDVDSIPVTDFPLYHNWSYDRIYRTDMIKQPDVLMFMFLYNREFPVEVKRANYEYYEPRTIHESSLSPSIHSIFASELGKHREAFDFFGFATRMDLDNYNRNTGEGLHTTSIAAAWVNIVYGFGGMRSDGPLLSFAPSLPAEWKGYEFRVQYRGAHVCVSVERKTVRFWLLGSLGQRVEILVYGQRLGVDSSGISVPLPETARD